MDNHIRGVGLAKRTPPPLLLVIIVSFFFQSAAYAQISGLSQGENSDDRLTTAELIANSASTACTNWCVTGVCMWLVCTPFGRGIKTTLRVRHGYPTLVVSVYNVTGEPTWEDAPIIQFDGSVLGFDMAGGMDAAENSPIVKRLDTHLKFKEVSVHANPYPSMIERIDYFCPVGTTPFMPHYSSEIDSLAWRSGLPERFYIWKYFEDIGNWPLYSWSPLYPRYGFINQRDDGHASAVAAVRGADIAHDSYVSAHLHIEIKEEEELNKNVGAYRYPKEHPWQRLTPNASDKCEILGDDNSADWSRDTNSAAGFNAWNYWHTYECCVPGAGALITYTSSGACPNE